MPAIFDGTWRDQSAPLANYIRTNAVTASGTETAAGASLCNCASGAITRTLPASPTTGQVNGFTKTDTSANALTIVANSGQTINGGTEIALTSYGDTLKLVFDGTNWVNSPI